MARRAAPIAGQNLKRMDAAMPAAAPCVPPLQFVAVELRCAASAGSTYAALLRALADTVAVF
ncbi:MAG: hypothetical protein EOP36_01725 [Rubrivivax sp.]|nr:MAG: hypothetical protein EOP36_01725 [Rubrivivax sp.]